MQSIFSLTYMKWLYVDVCSSCFQSNWIWCLSCKAYLVCVHSVPRGCLANSNPIYSFGFTATVVEAVCALWKHIVSIQESNSSFCASVALSIGLRVYYVFGCLTLLECLEIYWNYFSSWKSTGKLHSAGNCLAVFNRLLLMCPPVLVCRWCSTLCVLSRQ